VLFILREGHRLWTLESRVVRKGINLLLEKYRKMIRVF